MSRRTRLGFDRTIALEWLDATAAKVGSGASDTELRAYLMELLNGEVAGTNAHGAIGKTVTVLSHIWSRVPPECAALRARALGVLPTVEAPDRLALHWAMAMATYPFFSDVAAVVGRVLKLQGEVELPAVTRRLAAQWGDRSTMARAVPRVASSMAQWGALQSTGRRGTYRPTLPRRPVTGPLIEVLVEALLLDMNGRSLPVSHLETHPVFFPFSISLAPYALRRSGVFALHRQGLDTDVIELVRSSAGDQ